jgi:hypothetical protein
MPYVAVDYVYTDTHRYAGDSGILTNARDRYGADYRLVQHEVGLQVEAKHNISQWSGDEAILSRAQRRYGDDYRLVEYEANLQQAAYDIISEY